MNDDESEFVTTDELVEFLEIIKLKHGNICVHSGHSYSPLCAEFGKDTDYSKSIFLQNASFRRATFVRGDWGFENWYAQHRCGDEYAFVRIGLLIHFLKGLKARNGNIFVHSGESYGPLCAEFGKNDSYSKSLFIQDESFSSARPIRLWLAELNMRRG